MIRTNCPLYLLAVAAILLCAGLPKPKPTAAQAALRMTLQSSSMQTGLPSEAAPPAFYWGSGSNAPNLEGPFTFNAGNQVRLDVTDDFDKGDRFQVFDFGTSLGLTTLVPTLSGGEVGPQAAFSDPTYSHGSFFLPGRCLPLDHVKHRGQSTWPRPRLSAAC